MARHTSHHGPRSGQPLEDSARSAGAPGRRRKIVLAAGLAALVLLVASTATGAATKVYSIVYGDTLNEIAANHGTDIATLVGLNDIDNPDVIIAGDEIAVPDGDLTTYTVREGDTLADIAAMYGVDVRELVAVNKIDDADVIHPGVALLVYQPVEGGDATDEGTANAAGSEDAVDEGEVEEAAEDMADDDTGTDDAAGDPEAVDDEVESDTGDEAAPDDTGDDAASESGRLHLVRAGETLADVAAEYEVTEAQLIAANALDSSEIAPGMILKIPLAASAGVELIGMPAGQEQWPLMSELSAASLATAYWGAPVSADELLAALDSSENPHLGFRGDPHGMFGTTEDYGVYAGPLAEALAEFGFGSEAFYADGDGTALTAHIDAGRPVVVWVTYDLDMQERIVVDSEVGRYSLIPEQHAVLVYGYDDQGVKVMDVGTGTSAVWGWDEFMASWSLFDGMGLAVDLQ